MFKSAISGSPHHHVSQHSRRWDYCSMRTYWAMRRGPELEKPSKTSKKYRPWDSAQPCLEPCVDESSVRLKLQRHVSSLSRGCSFSLIFTQPNPSAEGHFDDLEERWWWWWGGEKFACHFLGTDLTAVDGGNRKPRVPRTKSNQHRTRGTSLHHQSRVIQRCGVHK